MGAVSGAGIGANALWQAARDGKSAIGPVELERPGQHTIKIAAQVKDFDPARHMDAATISFCDRFSQFAIVAGDEAMAQAKLSREQRLGELLPCIAPREHWVISTKVGESFDPGTEVSTYDFSRDAIHASVERSLSRLRVNCLDLVLLHFSSRGDIDLRTLQQGVAIGALRELQARGLVRHIGASVGSLAGGLHAVEVCDSVMVTLNAEDRTMLPVIEAARAKGVGVIVKKPLASGRLDADASLRLVCSTAGVSSAVVGTTNAAHLAQAVRAASGR